jgi:hypothetical protein
MKQILGILCFVITVAAVVTNAVVMIISPKMWFRMSHWIRLSGSLTEEKYASGWGAVQVRVLGVCFLLIMAYFLHGCLSR